MSTRPLVHPHPDSITVSGLMHALSDPIRLEIVSQLKTRCAGMNCSETMARIAPELPKSTCSVHFQILREAGLIQSERRGVELTNRLRCDELEMRFPGLLMAILKAYDSEKDSVPSQRKKNG